MFKTNESKKTLLYIAAIIVMICAMHIMGNILNDELKKKDKEKETVFCSVTVDETEYTDIVKDSIVPPLTTGGQIDFKDKNGNEYHLECRSYTVTEEKTQNTETI